MELVHVTMAGRDLIAACLLKQVSWTTGATGTDFSAAITATSSDTSGTSTDTGIASSVTAAITTFGILSLYFASRS